MSEQQWASLRKKIYLSLPYIQLITGGTVLALSDEIWQAITGLAVVWLLSPTMGTIAAKHVVIPSSPSQELMNRIHALPNARASASADDSADASADDSADASAEEGASVPCGDAHPFESRHSPGCEGWPERAL